MIPAYARPAHKKLRTKLADMEAWNNEGHCNPVLGNTEGKLGIIATGVAALHSLEAAPDAKVLKLGMVYPLPMKAFKPRCRRRAAGFAHASSAIVLAN